MHWKRNLFVLGAMIVGTGVLAAYWTSASKQIDSPEEEPSAEQAPPQQAEPFLTFIDPSKGPADAEVTIVEFGDHACPYCRSTQQAIDALMASYPGRVRFVWKSAPTPLHPGSDIAARAALCADRQGKFWEFHDRLFAEGTLLDETSMIVLANDLRLDPVNFGACMTDKATQPLVDRTVTEARALGLTGIPTVYVNGVRHEGAMSYEDLVAAAGL